MANAASGGSAVVRIDPASRYYPFSTIDPWSIPRYSAFSSLQASRCGAG